MSEFYAVLVSHGYKNLHNKYAIPSAVGMDLESMDGYSKENVTIKEYSEADDTNPTASASQSQVSNVNLFM